MCTRSDGGQRGEDKKRRDCGARYRHQQGRLLRGAGRWPGPARGRHRPSAVARHALGQHRRHGGRHARHLLGGVDRGGDVRRARARGHRRRERRLGRLAQPEPRGRHRPSRDRRARRAPRAAAHPSAGRDGRPRHHPFRGDRLLGRRHAGARRARHVRRAAGRRRPSGHGGQRRDAQPAGLRAARPSRDRRPRRGGARRGAELAGVRRARSRRHPDRHGRRHDLDRRVLRGPSRARRIRSRSAASTSPATSPAACRRRWSMPSA